MKNRTWILRTPHGGINVFLRETTDSILARKVRPCGPDHDFDLLGEGGYSLVYGTIDHSRCDPSKKRCPHSGVTSYETISETYQILEQTRIEESIRRRAKDLGWDWKSERTPISAIIDGVGEGSRNDSAFRMAIFCIRTLHIASENDLLGALDVWNLRNKPPLPDQEIEMIARSALSRARNGSLPTGVFKRDASW
jgi:hypothetical protein